MLVLDDDPADLRSLERLFAAHGHQVQGVMDPAKFFKVSIPPLPACVVIDQNLGVATGTEVQTEMKRRGWAVPAVILTSQGDTRAVVRAMLNGADDCLAKPYDPHELVTAVGRAVGRCIENQQAEQWRAEIRQRAATLSPRERAIVSLVVAGLLNKQIGDRLNLALVTVKVHRGRAMRKLGARSAADLAHLALSAGITCQY